MSWGYHGNIKGVSWEYHGDNIGISWGYHGDIIGISWGYHGDFNGHINGHIMGIREWRLKRMWMLMLKPLMKMGILFVYIEIHTSQSEYHMLAL